MKRNQITVLDWAYPVGRNSKGRFVSIKNMKLNGSVDPDGAKPEETKPEEKKEPKAKKVKGPVIEITEAIYGGEVEGEMKTLNVTEAIKYGRKVTNKNCGGTDPAPKVKKTLSVKALVDGKPIEKQFAEGEKLTF
jgi:hypothetical protein